MTDKSVTFTADGKTLDLPTLPGSVGPDVVDIRKFYADTGMFTYDPGYTSTASCQSAITYIDGDQGILLHRGFPIDQLAERSSFMEVSYLLLHGDLPSAEELEEFSYTITRHTMVHEQLATFFRGSGATRTRWRSCAAWSARSPVSITIRPTSPTRSNG